MPLSRHGGSQADQAAREDSWIASSCFKFKLALSKVAEWGDLDGEGEGGTEALAELGVIDDASADELLAHDLHHFLAEERAAAALDQEPDSESKSMLNLNLNLKHMNDLKFTT